MNFKLNPAVFKIAGLYFYIIFLTTFPIFCRRMWCCVCLYGFAYLQNSVRTFFACPEAPIFSATATVTNLSVTMQKHESVYLPISPSHPLLQHHKHNIRYPIKHGRHNAYLLISELFVHCSCHCVSLVGINPQLVTAVL